MKITKYELWEEIPGTKNTSPYIVHYAPDRKITEGCVVILPGSGYEASPSIPKQEGDRVAEYICKKGVNVFVAVYRVAPDFFPLPILDGRRAVRYIRHHSGEFGIDKNRIAVMGFSAGGHLAASLSAYFDTLQYENIDEADKESCIPNLQILCYPVIGVDDGEDYSHVSSGKHLLDGQYDKLKEAFSFAHSSSELVPPTFLWHNFDDRAVSVVNSLRYAENLRKKGVSVEMHIFPDGDHGIGLPTEDRRDYNHNRKWITLCMEWLGYHHFFE